MKNEIRDPELRRRVEEADDPAKACKLTIELFAEIWEKLKIPIKK